MFKAIFHASTALLLLGFPLFYGPAQAIAQVAPGVQQSAAQTATITGSVVRSDDTPVAGATIRLAGPGTHLETASDAHGTFSFTSVPYGIYRIDAVGVSLGAASRAGIVVKGDMSVSIQYEAQGSGLKEIARVSTSNAGSSINVTAASVASITPSAYMFQGNTSWKQMLNQIPGVVVGGDLAIGRGVDTVVDAPTQSIVLSINGALPYETSVTLDGMPIWNASSEGSPGDGDDLSLLSMATFDTADVVRGPGANAPSIVDAIGGSFVLHAPGPVDKNSLEFSLSDDPYGGIVSNVKGTLRLGRLSAVIAYGVNDSPGPLGSPSVLSPLFANPNTINGAAFVSCSSSPCGTYISPPKYGNLTSGGCYCEIQSSLLYCCTPVSSAWTQHNGSIALSYNVTPSITAQIFYSGSSTVTEMPGTDSLTDFSAGFGYAGSISPGLQPMITAVPVVTPQSQSLLEEKITASAGHGILRLAALQGNSFSSFSFENLNPGSGEYRLYGTGCVGTGPVAASCPFGGMLTAYNGSPEVLASTSEAIDYWQRVNNRDLLGSYATQLGSKSTATASFVTSYYNNPWTESLVLGGTAIPLATQPTDEDETTNELRLHVGTELSDKFTVDASWYFADGSYHLIDPTNANAWVNSTFSDSAPRLSAVWRVNQDMAVRAAVGAGFALAPLDYLATSDATYLCGPYYLEYASNLNIKPETSVGFDVGTDIRMRHNTIMSVDFYRTNLYNQFYESTHLTGTFAGLPLYTAEFGNLGKSRYEGINFDVRHDTPTGMYWHGALGLTRAYVVYVPPGFYDSPATGPNSVNTYVVLGPNFNGIYESPVPYATATAQIGYRWGPEKYIDLSPTYYGNDNPYFDPAFVEFDAHAGYPLTRNITLLAIFRNIGGIYDQTINYRSPENVYAAPTIAGPLYPILTLPYGPRTVVVTLNLKY